MTPEDMKKVGGSDVAAIMGMDPYRGPLGVWTRIVHGVTTPDNPAMRRGRALEAGVLALYVEETGRCLYYGQDTRHEAEIPAPWRVTLDARSRGDRYDGPLRVVEVKTAGRNSSAAWGEPGTDQVPDGYALQVQWYMGWGLRTGRVDDAQADVAALLAGDFALYHVQFDAEVFGVLEERAARFWRDHVETGKPPPDVPLPADTELVRRIRRTPDVPPVLFAALGPREQSLVFEYLSSLREIASWEKAAMREKTALMLAVAGAGGISGLPPETGYARIAWGARKGRTTTDWEAVAKNLANEAGLERGDGSTFARIVAELTTTSEPTRAWRPVPLKEQE